MLRTARHHLGLPQEYPYPARVKFALFDAKTVSKRWDCANLPDFVRLGCIDFALIPRPFNSNRSRLEQIAVL